MTSRPFRIMAAVAAAALLLGGCAVTDKIGGWFSGGPHKSKLKGQRISVMSFDESVKPDPTLKDIGVILPPPYRNTEWPEPGGYADNAMYHLEASGSLQQIWQQDAGAGSNSDSRLTAPPIVAGGKIYVLDARARVYAFDANSGEPAWHVSVAPLGHRGLFSMLSFGLFGENTKVDATKGFGGGIAFDGGKLFVSTGFGDVVALDAASGKELWRINTGVPIFNAPVANGGRVFVSAQDNHFHAYAQNNGRELWDHQGRHSRKQQRCGRRRIRHRPLHVGRALRTARAKRAPGLERHAHALGQCDRAVRTRRHRRTAGRRPGSGVRDQPFRRHDGDSARHRRPAVDA
jgi:hypothetical protein